MNPSRRDFTKASIAAAGFAAASGIPGAGLAKAPADAVVETRAGKVRGAFSDGVYSFKGTAWATFAATGVPAASGLPRWPRLHAGKARNDDLRARSAYRKRPAGQGPRAAHAYHRLRLILWSNDTT